MNQFFTNSPEDNTVVMGRDFLQGKIAISQSLKVTACDNMLPPAFETGADALSEVVQDLEVLHPIMEVCVLQ